VYCCGWRMCLADALFPDAADVMHLEDMHEKDAVTSLVASFRENDVLI
jgi:hypothetical protein